MTVVGVISDTHGLLRPQAVEALRGAAHILHAGDIGDPDILEKLESVAPVTAVRGNVDGEAWSREIPKSEVVEIEGVSIYMLHILAELDLKPEAAGFGVVVYGHLLQSGERGATAVQAAGDCGEADHRGRFRPRGNHQP